MVEKKIWEISISRMFQNETWNKSRKAVYGRFAKIPGNFGFVISDLVAGERKSVKELYFILKLSTDQCKMVWDKYDSVQTTYYEALILFSSKDDFIRIKSHIVEWATINGFEITSKWDSLEESD